MRWPSGPPRRRPDSFRFWLAEALLRGERYIEAEQRYAEVIEKYPHSAYRPQALYGLAFARFKLGHFNAAMQRWMNSTSSAPTRTWRKRPNFFAGRFISRLQQFEQSGNRPRQRRQQISQHTRRVSR
jgi:hypothetical protein